MSQSRSRTRDKWTWTAAGGGGRRRKHQLQSNRMWIYREKPTPIKLGKVETVYKRLQACRPTRIHSGEEDDGQAGQPTSAATSRSISRSPVSCKSSPTQEGRHLRLVKSRCCRDCVPNGSPRRNKRFIIIADVIQTTKNQLQKQEVCRDSSSCWRRWDSEAMQRACAR